MNPRQARFVAAYLATGNATAACKDAGYSPKTAYAQGCALLKHPEVTRALENAKAQAITEGVLTIQEANLILSEIARGGSEFARIKAIETIGRFAGWESPQDSDVQIRVVYEGKSIKTAATAATPATPINDCPQPRTKVKVY